jgi:hypothetical protein
LLAAVDTTALLKIVGYSLVISVAVTFVFSLGIVGMTRSTECRRDRRTIAASVYSAVAVLALGTTALAAVLGIIAMTQK